MKKQAAVLAAVLLALAVAGAATAQDVAAGEAVGQRRGLDGSGGRDALLLQDLGERGRDAEVGEGHVSCFRLASRHREPRFCDVRGVRASSAEEGCRSSLFWATTCARGKTGRATVGTTLAVREVFP